MKRNVLIDLYVDDRKGHILGSPSATMELVESVIRLSTQLMTDDEILDALRENGYQIGSEHVLP